MYTSATDCYGRSVYYTYETVSGIHLIVGSESELYQVSEVVASGTSSPPVRYQYGYALDGNAITDRAGNLELFQYLNTISVPSPTGSGMSTETITCDAVNGLLSGIEDANGNTMSFSGGTTSNETTVTYANSSSTNEYQYTVSFDANMDITGLFDSAGNTVYTANYSGSSDPFTTTSNR